MILKKLIKVVSGVLFFGMVVVPLSTSSLAYAGQLSIENVTTIFDGATLFNHFCAVCHGKQGNGKGINAVNVDPPPADFTNVERMSGRTDAKLFKVISKGGKGAALSSKMPPWGHTLSKGQIWSLVRYVRSFSNTVGEITGAMPAVEPVHSKDFKCAICHLPVAGRRIIAPDLGYERSKFTRNWLVGFLKKPIRIRPLGYVPLTKSKMPEFQFTDTQSEALAEYLLHRAESTSEETLARESGPIDITPKNIKKGKKLFRKYGCKGCHRINGKGGIVGPDLTKSAHRLKPYWVFKWLKNPQAIRPDAPMPNFNLKDEKIKQLVAYIIDLKEESAFPVTSVTSESGLSKRKLYNMGKKLVDQKNCLGCHYMHTGNDKGYVSKVVVPMAVSVAGSTVSSISE